MKKWTNVDNTLIKTNYKKLIATKTRVWVRTPIIPGATDSKENIEQIAKFIKDNGYPERWELCSFNNLATDKYERLGKKWQFANKQLLTKEIMESLTSIAKQYVPMVKWTGATKIEE
jgi:pyruvate formate lyase activating enzyme